MKKEGPKLKRIKGELSAQQKRVVKDLRASIASFSPSDQDLENALRCARMQRKK